MTSLQTTNYAGNYVAHRNWFKGGRFDLIRKC
jgi:hypothetical protein